MIQIYAALEAVMFAVAFVVAGGVSHLTWWNALMLAACDVAYVWDSTSTVYVRVWQAYASLASLVQLTVVIMSLMGCSMVRDTLTEVGPWLYYFGNFALHYWPTLRAAALRPSSSPALYYDAARILAVYATLYRPEQVYSCDQVSEFVVMPLGISAAVLLEWLISTSVREGSKPLTFSYGSYFTRN